MELFRSWENMAVANDKSVSDVKVWSFCRLPFWHHGGGPSSLQNQLGSGDQTIPHSSIKVASVAKSLLPTRRRLTLDPPNKLYFPCMCFWFSRFLLPIAKVIEVLLLFFLQIIEKCFKDYVKMLFICLLIYPDEPGKQVKSSIRIKNISKTHIAFKVRVSISFFNSQTKKKKHKFICIISKCMCYISNSIPNI